MHERCSRTSYARDPRQIGHRLPAESAERPTGRRQNGLAGIQRRISSPAAPDKDRQQFDGRERAGAQMLQSLARPVTAT
jgi:hypothetical protein